MNATPIHVNMEFVNYKLLKNKSFNLEGYNVIIVQGPNETGKSSLRTALKEAWMVKSLTKEPLTKDEEQGMVKIQVPDKDGNTVTIHHTFNKFDQTGTFWLVDKEGKAINSPTKIREMMGDYEPINMSEIYIQAKSAEGRRKLLKDKFLKCLPEKDRNELEEIEKEVQEDRGTLFMDRRTHNSMLKDYKARQQSYILTDDELIDLSKANDARKRIDELQKEYDNQIKTSGQYEANKTILFTLQFDLEKTENRYVIRMKEIDIQLARIEVQIKELQEQKTVLLEEQQERTEQYATDTAKSKQDIHNLEEKIKSENYSDVTELATRIANGNTFLKEKIIPAQEKQKAFLELDSVIKEKEMLIAGLNEKIDAKRKRRQKIYATANLPGGIAIGEDGDMTVNNLPMTEEQISDSTMGLILLELACHISQAKLIDGGRASDYGNERLNKIISIAEKYNKLVILEKVEDVGDIQLVGIIKHDE